MLVIVWLQAAPPPFRKCYLSESQVILCWVVIVCNLQKVFFQLTTSLRNFCFSYFLLLFVFYSRQNTLSKLPSLSCGSLKQQRVPCVIKCSFLKEVPRRALIILYVNYLKWDNTQITKVGSISWCLQVHTL
jgi:hypothetical protein